MIMLRLVNIENKINNLNRVIEILYYKNGVNEIFLMLTLLFL